VAGPPSALSGIAGGAPSIGWAVVASVVGALVVGGTVMGGAAVGEAVVVLLTGTVVVGTVVVGGVVVDLVGAVVVVVDLPIARSLVVADDAAVIGATAAGEGGRAPPHPVVTMPAARAAASRSRLALNDAGRHHVAP
jgi:hypothetical protein